MYLFQTFFHSSAEDTRKDANDCEFFAVFPMYILKVAQEDAVALAQAAGEKLHSLSESLCGHSLPKSLCGHSPPQSLSDQDCNEADNEERSYHEISVDENGNKGKWKSKIRIFARTSNKSQKIDPTQN